MAGFCPTFVADVLVTAATTGSAGMKRPVSAPPKNAGLKGARSNTLGAVR